MNHSLRIALVLPAVAACTAWVAAADLGLSPTPGVLLLNNGELISGTITDAGDRYDVRLEGGEINVKRSQVALVARDANECYLHKRAGIESGRPQDHLDLAEWCLRNDLSSAAEKEVSAAKAIDAVHPRIALLEARLRLAREKPQPVEPARHEPNKPPSEPLDAVVHNLPAGSVEGFTNNVQPLLLNYCARAGCHASQAAGGFKLERIPPNRYAGRKPTQRNLRSVLASIDRAKPNESKLLSAPIRPHGGGSLAIFTDREQSQYRQLVQWVYQVAGARQPARQPTLEERSAPLLERGPREVMPAADTSTDTKPTEAHSAPSGNDESPVIPADSKTAPGAPGAATQLAPQPFSAKPLMPPGGPPANPAGFVPKDPFDPEIFNRRFGRT